MNKSIALSLLLIMGTASAQQANNSGAASESISQAGASSNTSNAISFLSSTPEQQTLQYTGDYKVRTAPGTILGGFSGSFSSDYCGGTAQVGASWLGGSFGGGKPVMDAQCQRLRRVERFGQLASSVGGENTVLGRKLNQMAVFELCSAEESTKAACKVLGLVVAQ